MCSFPAGRLLSRHIDLQPPAQPRDGDGRAPKQLPVSDTSWRPASDLTVVSGGLGAGFGSCFDCLIRLEIARLGHLSLSTLAATCYTNTAYSSLPN